MTKQYRVETFGSDCLGNISGYRVRTGYGWDSETADQFVANLYVDGSLATAKRKADALCAKLNSASVRA